MVDNLTERFQSDASLRNVPIEKAYPNNDIGEFAELGHLFWGGQRDERSQPCARQDRFECRGHLSFNRVRNCRGQLDIRVVPNDVLLVLVQQIVEDLLVEERDAFEVVGRARLKTHNLVNQSI